VEQVTASVRWEEGIRYLVGEGFRRFIELGPGKALSGFLKRIDQGAQTLNVADAPSLLETAKTITG
jgi:[acyl-carrier-protein] S-malonyltransferase